MKRFEVILSDKAESDLLEIYKWVDEAAGRLVADRFYDRLREAAESLQYFPNRGVLREAISLGARILVVRNYLILYRVSVDRVEILRIVYGSVDLTNLPS